MARWIPKINSIPSQPVTSEVVTPEMLIEGVDNDDEKGWQTTTKVTRHNVIRPFVLSQPSRGFE